MNLRQFEMRLIICFILGALTLPLYGQSLSEAHKSFKDGNYESAAKGFAEAVAREPSDYENHYNLGVSRFALQQFSEAEVSFKLAAQSKDKKLKADALYNLATIQASQGKFEDAEKTYKEALSYDLDNQKIKDNLAWVREQQASKPPEQSSAQNDQNQKSDDAKRNGDPSANEQHKNSDQSQNSEQKEATNDQQKSGDGGQDKTAQEKGEQNSPGQPGSDEQGSEQKRDEAQASSGSQNEAEGKKEQQSAAESNEGQREKSGEKEQKSASSAESQSKGENPSQSKDAFDSADGKSKTPDELAKKDLLGEKEAGDESDPSNQKDSLMTGDSEAEQESQQGQNGQTAAPSSMTQDAAKRQDAEFLIRGVEDRVGRLMFRPEQAGEQRRQRSGNTW